MLLGLSLAAHDPASHHVKAISVVGAVCLLVVYMAWVVPYLRSDTAPGHGRRSRRATPRRTPPADRGRAARRLQTAHVPEPRLSLALTLALLIAGGVASAFVSEWFVNALEPAIGMLHISQAFAGLVIVAIAGNAVENVAGLVLAYKRRSDLAISVVKNSVAQIAAFLFPLLVLVSFALTTTLTFALAPVYIGALALTALGALAGHRRRRGRRIRGLGAGRPVRDPRHAHAVRVARAHATRPGRPAAGPIKIESRRSAARQAADQRARQPAGGRRLGVALFASSPSSGAMNIVWIARRPGPVKRFHVSLPPPPIDARLQAHRHRLQLHRRVLVQPRPRLHVQLLAVVQLTRNTLPCPCSHTSASPSVARNLSMKKPEPPSSMFCTPLIRSKL